MTDEQTSALITELQKHTAALQEYTTSVNRLKMSVGLLVDMLGSESVTDNQPVTYLDGKPLHGCLGPG